MLSKVAVQGDQITFQIGLIVTTSHPYARNVHKLQFLLYLGRFMAPYGGPWVFTSFVYFDFLIICVGTDASRGAGVWVCDCKHGWLWVRASLEKMKYLLKFIFSFLRSGDEAQGGVEFRRSTRKSEFSVK